MVLSTWATNFVALAVRFASARRNWLPSSSAPRKSCEGTVAISMQTRLNEFLSFARGWLAYFKLAQIKTTFRDLDKWLRRRVRACYLKQWRESKTRLKQLIKLGVSKRAALGAAKSGKGPWRLSRTVPAQRGLSIEFLAEQGLFNLEECWESLHQ